MQDVIIDKEFSTLFPALGEQAYAWLEGSILEHGCREPVVLWNGIIIDGHNRYEISMKHGVAFSTVNMEFDSRDKVVIWIIETQMGRRNLTPMQLSYFRGLHYITEKMVQGTANQHSNKSENRHNVGFKQQTARRLGEVYNVSSRTIERDAQVAAGITAIGRASPDAKMDILSGKTRISRKQLRELAAGSEEATAEVATSIEEGTFAQKKPGAPEADGGSEPVNSDHAETLQIEKEFNRLTSIFSSELRNHAKSGDKVALRSAIRSYIDMLENMYKNI